MVKLKDLQAFLERREKLYYKKLLSGDTKKRQSARKSIAEIESELAHQIASISALALLDDVKLWLANNSATKSLQFLHDLRNRADHLVGVDNWKVNWIKGRVYRVAGKYKRALHHYRSSIAEIESRTISDEVVHDVYADYAEFMVYLGDPAEAIRIIDGLGAANRVGWHYWVKAFAIHQNAFAQKYRFPLRAGDFPVRRPPTYDPGEAQFYEDSNVEIQNAISSTNKPIAGLELCDIELLRAANFGALIRRGDGDAGLPDDAKEAIDRFMGAACDPQNATWSIYKEKRGRFVRVFRRTIYDDARYRRTPGEEAERWQTEYQKHFFDNLRAADPRIRDSQPDDGVNEDVENLPD